MSSSEAHVNKMKHRQGYRNVWHTDLMSTMAADTPYCCFALFCGPCASYLLRKRALYGDMSKYVCCGGFMPCSGRCGERKCPKFCLCTEVFLCFGNSVASTRFMLQDEFHIQTTKCDNCIIGCMLCLQQLACIFSIIACLVGSEELSDVSHLLNCIANLVFCTVCTCMQTQHKVEMDKRDGKFRIRPMDVPPIQQMSRIDQPNAQYAQPPYGYPLPQHQTQGYPPPVYYPPQGQGYPPQGQGHPPQGQGHPPGVYPPPPQDQGHPPGVYPLPPQGQGTPPCVYPPPPQGQGTPPGVYPPPPQGQGHSPAAYPPPPQGQEYPPAANYPSQPPPSHPPQGQGNQPSSNYEPTNNQTPGQQK